MPRWKNGSASRRTAMRRINALRKQNNQLRREAAAAGIVLPPKPKPTPRAPSSASKPEAATATSNADVAVGVVQNDWYNDTSPCVDEPKVTFLFEDYEDPEQNETPIEMEEAEAAGIVVPSKATTHGLTASKSAVAKKNSNADVEVVLNDHSYHNMASPFGKKPQSPAECAENRKEAVFEHPEQHETAKNKIDSAPPDPVENVPTEIPIPQFTYERCRLCLSFRRSTFHNIFETTMKISGQPVSEMIMSIASVLVIEGDGLPESVCTFCLATIADFERFRDKVQSCNSSLLAEIGQKLTHRTDSEGLKSLWNCELCEATFTKYEKYRTHSCRTLACCECGENFTSVDRLRRHEKGMHGSILNSHIIPCDQCPKTFAGQDDLVNHKAKEHPRTFIKEDFVCQICGKNFRMLKSLTLHVKLHSEQEEMEIDPVAYEIDMPKPKPNSTGKLCDLCGFTGWGQHRCRCIERPPSSSSPPPPESLYCDLCEKSLKNKRNLEAHLKSHSEKLCHFCGYKGWKGFYNHSCPGRLVYCDVCGRPFMKKEQLQTHLRTHTKETPFECKFCHKKFSILWNRNQHERIHTGELPFQCSSCGLCFRYKCSLKAHLSKCSGAGLTR